jgi:hypothetical protein
MSCRCFKILLPGNSFGVYRQDDIRDLQTRVSTQRPASIGTQASTAPEGSIR